MEGNSTEMMSTDKYRRWIFSPIGRLLLEADVIGLTTLYIEATDCPRDDGEAESACEQKNEDKWSGAVSVYGQKDGDALDTVGSSCQDRVFEERSECVQMRILDQAQRELEEYFAGARQIFETPLHMQGTRFQQQVWNALRQIPYGETRSYADIARMIGNPQACRAVGGANNKNKILLMIPCHRVVGKSGDLTGFAAGLQVKAALLKLERDTVTSICTEGHDCQTID